MTKYLLVFLLFILAASCHRKQPSGVMGESDMRAVLYDYHISKAMAYQTDSVEYYKRYYFLEVLKKYRLSEEAFNTSMLWYSQHTDILYKIYDDINKQLNKESMALGVVTSDSHYYSSLSNVGDTANIWNGRAYYILSPVGINNRFTFMIPADSTSRPKDTYLLHMVSRFVFAEGQRDAIVNMSVTYVDDSVQSVTVPVYGDGEFKCELKTADKEMKSISGFVHLKNQYSAKPKLMIVTSPALIRFHERKHEVSADEISEKHPPRDSVMLNANDTLIAEPVFKKHPALHEKPIPFRKRR